MNRQELLDAYIDRILDNMSTKDLMRIVGDQIEENLSGYSDEELIAEVEEYYPHEKHTPRTPRRYHPDG